MGQSRESPFVESVSSFVLQFDMLISEADKDGDGNLDYEEFVQLMSQQPAK